MHTPATTSPTEKLLRVFEVEDLTAMKKSKLYDLVKQGQFPAPVRIGPRAVRWRLSAVQKWIDGLKTDTTGKEGEA
jgi:prophage regulatory protein